jgi:hypothetical protein
MSGRPAVIRQRDCKQIINAAKKAGARQVQVNLPGGTSIVIPLVPDDDKPVADTNEWLDDAHQA